MSGGHIPVDLTLRDGPLKDAQADIAALKAEVERLTSKNERLRSAAERVLACDSDITDLCEDADRGWTDELEFAFNELRVALKEKT